MFERYLTDILATHFGHFIENIDHEKVRLSTWNGQLILSDLHIRRDALDTIFSSTSSKQQQQQQQQNPATSNDVFESKSTVCDNTTTCPFEISYGHIGNLELCIPWKQLFRPKGFFSSSKTDNSSTNATTSTSTGNTDSKEELSINVVLSDINILITPRRRSDSTSTGGTCSNNYEPPSDTIYDELSELTSSQRETLVQTALDAELLRRIRSSASTTTTATTKNDDQTERSDAKLVGSWIQDKLASFLSNLSVTVNNVHLRYEDPGTWLPLEIQSTIFHKCFAMGITLKSFTINTKQSVVQELKTTTTIQNQDESSSTIAPGSRRSKVVQVENLESYWDSDCDLIMSDRGKHLDDDIEAQYFCQTFHLLNHGVTSQSTLSLINKNDQNTFQRSQHFYLLEPFSSTINVVLPVLINDQQGPIDAGTIEFVSNSCSINVSRSMLEDLGYLRKSVSLWYELEQSTVLLKNTNIIEIRPLQGPLYSKDVARRWWIYAYEAVVTLQNIKRSLPIDTKRRSTNVVVKYTGWIALAKGLGNRRRYLVLFISFLQTENEEERHVLHDKLLDLEKELETMEVVMFRFSAHDALRNHLHSHSSSTGSSLSIELQSKWKQEDILLPSGSNNTNFTMNHRYRMFTEMAQAFERMEENATVQQQQTEHVSSTSTIVSNRILWKSSFLCSKISLQLNEWSDTTQELSFQRRSTQPIARLSLAIAIEHDLSDDSSWNLSTQIGALILKDCTVRDNNASKHFPNILGPNVNQQQNKADTTFSIGDTTHDQIVMIQVCRSWKVNGSHPRSATITHIQVKVLPLEIVYSVSPFKAVNQIIDAINHDFADGYQRLSSRLGSWKRRQQTRLYNALTQKEKKIVVDIDLRAPVFLIPENIDGDNNMIAVDLGNLRLRNSDLLGTESGVIFGENWKLQISAVQVLACSTFSYRNINCNLSAPHQLIEPCNLDVSITTCVRDFSSEEQRVVRVRAILPRLIFNVTTSAMNLVRNLQSQWKEKVASPTSSGLLPRPGASNDAPNTTKIATKVQSNHLLEFKFSAPLLRVVFQDNLDTKVNHPETSRLFDLTLNGLACNYERESFLVDSKVSTSMDAKIQSIHVIDLHQKIGPDFSLLLSSVTPDIFLTNQNVDTNQNGTVPLSEVVTVHCVSSNYSSNDKSEIVNTMDIKFNELYIEWNPETLAAISQAIKIPSNVVADDPNLSSNCENDDSYFDANEDNFYDAQPTLESIEFNDLPYEHQEGLSAPFDSSLTKLDPVGFQKGQTQIILDEVALPFRLSLNLNKLRISFNKDARHRKVFVAEMDRTIVHRTTYDSNRSKMDITIGNLTFSDCESAKHKTLYKEILGLKTDQLSKDPEHSSLLEMSIIRQPRVREWKSLEHVEENLLEESSVSVDEISGIVHGFDTYIQANLSPMRFVYLQQSWMEIVDYCFEGILGYEVWGSVAPTILDVHSLTGKIIGAEQIPFTRFDIILSTPDIIVPVSFCSTEFIRVEASELRIQNHYSYTPIRAPSSDIRSDELQWFNNCQIRLVDITIKSWVGHRLDVERSSAFVAMAWPVGPKALLNRYKWKIDSSIHWLTLALQREDLALFQHAAQFNLGSETRHMEEWQALQSLPVENRGLYESRTKVHFSYDKKDVAPTTFHMKLLCPSVSIRLLDETNKDMTDFRFADFCWEFTKFQDYIGKQKLTSLLKVFAFASSQLILQSDEETDPAIKYISISASRLKLSRLLEVNRASVIVDYAEWMKIASFLNALPLPSFVNPKEVIQVGDRWYKIGFTTPSVEPICSSNFAWIEDCKEGQIRDIEQDAHEIEYSFRFRLLHASLSLQGIRSSIWLSVQSIELSKYTAHGSIRQGLEVAGFSARSDRSSNSDKSMLIQPWNFSILKQQSTEVSTNNVGSSYANITVTADILDARIAFSGLQSAIDVAISYVDIIQMNRKTRKISASEVSDHSPAQENDQSTVISSQYLINCLISGFSILIVDDSGRHFANDQDLVLMVMDTVQVVQQKEIIELDVAGLEGMCTIASRLLLKGVAIFDCLQPQQSQFRDILEINSDSCVTNDENGGAKSNFNSNLSNNAKPLNCEELFDPAVDIWNNAAIESVTAIKVQNCKCQYNPSLIIALQRFIGRLLKDGAKQYDDLHSFYVGEHIQTMKKDHSQSEKRIKSASFHMCDFRIRLNKEHQQRSLVELKIVSCEFKFEQGRTFSILDGSVREIQLMDYSTSNRRLIINSLHHAGNLLSMRYASFPHKKIDQAAVFGCIPNWMREKLETDQNIDDFLDISMLSLEIVYIRGLTEELVDYLGNGMPGKGMGVTSKAATGFMTSRSQKRSFFNVSVATPKLFVPNLNEFNSGIYIHLGDLAVISWLAGSQQDNFSPRCTEVTLANFSVGVFRMNIVHKEMIPNVDISMSLEQCPSTVTIHSRVTDLTIQMAYTDYEEVHAVYHTNIGKLSRKENWDNLESSWSYEVVSDTVSEDNLTQPSNAVIYSATARHVRFGQSKKAESERTTKFNLAISSLSILLRRDDRYCQNHHDFLLVRFQLLETCLHQKCKGDVSVTFSVSKIFAFDLGWNERNMKELSGSKGAFTLLAGYSPPEQATRAIAQGDCFDSQIVLTCEKGGNGNIRVVLVLSCLGFVYLTGPVRDAVSFFVRDWSEDSNPKPKPLKEMQIAESRTIVSYFGDKVEMQLVLHYPQITFAADEIDLQSRSLVLRGLAIANASYERESDTSESQPSVSTESSPEIIKITADVQNLSTFMHPDTSILLKLDADGARILNSVLKCEHAVDELNRSDLSVSEVAVPLLLPLTAGFDAEQVNRPGSPISRSLTVNMEPLSVVFCYDDIAFLQTLAAKLSSNEARQRARSPKNFLSLYNVIFSSTRLGLSLRKDGERILVDSISSNEEQAMAIQAGDTLFSINDDIVFDASNTHLANIVTRLGEEARPIKLSFVRLEDDSKVDHNVTTQISKSAVRGSINKIDVSLAAAVMTLAERDVPLLKATLRKTKVGYCQERIESTQIDIDISSTILLEYYNLRVWGWEPFIEPSDISVSITYNISVHKLKEVAVEISDRGDGLIINISDSFIKSARKAIEWRQRSDERIEYETTFSDRENDESGILQNTSNAISTNAANAALKYAIRQKSDTSKSFLFRNFTGLSVALVQQTEGTGQDLHSKVILGGYQGLDKYNNSTVTIVGNGEELKFRVDGLVQQKKGKGELTFPLLTVALQEVNGVCTEPFSDLPIVHTGTTLIPLVLADESKPVYSTLIPERVWALWSVDKEDERTVLALGSSIRLNCLLKNAVDIGVKIGKDQSIKFVGVLRPGEPFCMPLWLALQSNSWQCLVKLSGAHSYSLLFECSHRGFVNFGTVDSKTIKCEVDTGNDKNSWLAAYKESNGEVVVVNLESTINIRNLLPSSVEFHVKEGSGDCDTSNERVISTVIQPGENADLFTMSAEHTLVRVRPVNMKGWSEWREVGSLLNPLATTSFFVIVVDEMNTPHSIGLRALSKMCGVELLLFSEFWCTNCTDLNLVFGCPLEHLTDRSVSRSRSRTFGEPKEVISAEAALKEISSLLEIGYEGVMLNETKYNTVDIVRLADQCAATITEECYEYVEIHLGVVTSHWWASMDPFHALCDPLEEVPRKDELLWLSNNWEVDAYGRAGEGWDSSPTSFGFASNRIFNDSHSFRRRRWIRTRRGLPKDALLDGVNGYYHPIHHSPLIRDEGNDDKPCTRIALRIDGGRWSLTSELPEEGTIFGAIRIPKTTWNSRDTTKTTHPVPVPSIYELCYSLQPLEGEWGLYSRSFIVSSRFVLRNNSKMVDFEIKQIGSPDSTSLILAAGGTCSFHWYDSRMPELISVRPLELSGDQNIYRWSGGFDPLTIGSVPIRVRQRKLSGMVESTQYQNRICAIKLETEIRTRTGGTGITISFMEEDEKGAVALFRIENGTTFPLWFGQDGTLANPSIETFDAERDGDILPALASSVFALDVPYRQGKYAHRKNATMSELLRVRVALAPLSSREGIETMKVVALTTLNEQVRLHPGKLLLLPFDLRSKLEQVRLLGTVTNDGPTRVLVFRLVAKTVIDVFTNPFQDTPLTSTTTREYARIPPFVEEVSNGAYRAAELHQKQLIPSDSEEGFHQIDPGTNDLSDNGNFSSVPPVKKHDGIPLVVTARIAFKNITASLIDAAPSELCVLSLKNVNAVSNWSTDHSSDSTVFITIGDLQVDNMLPNAAFPVAVCRDEDLRLEDERNQQDHSSPLLVVGLSFAPRHKSGIMCLKSATLAPRNLSVRVDLAFLVRLQRFVSDAKRHFTDESEQRVPFEKVPDIRSRLIDIETAAKSGVGRQRFYFGGLTILPSTIKLSVAPARALTAAQAHLEGAIAAAIHQAVRKGDVRLDKDSIIGVKLGSRNDTAMAVVRGIFKSFVVDALLRLDGASLHFAGVFLHNHTTTGPQLKTALGAHYVNSLRQNVPALVGSMAAIGNPMGLVKGLGDGVSDFVLEPVKGLQRSVQEMDASYLVDGVARGTFSLARNTVGGFADSAAMIAETFSKNMTVLTLDRRYAQKRDRREYLRDQEDVNVALGIGSGVNKVATGFLDGVTGVVKAPIRGAEKRGLEGFAKGLGKGLLGLLVKPIIGISDGFGDVMIGVKGSVDAGGGRGGHYPEQVRIRRAFYGPEKALRVYNVQDSAAAALMLRTRLAGEAYFSHFDMVDRVALFSVKRLLIIGPNGQELLLLKFKHIESWEIRAFGQGDNTETEWGIIVILNTLRSNGSEIEVIACHDQMTATQLSQELELATNAMYDDEVN